ncbi:MAG: SbcC/MukB-like Walker B domain-containing protein, partial [Acidimicrobiales bacterium]
ARAAVDLASKAEIEVGSVGGELQQLAEKAVLLEGDRQAEQELLLTLRSRSEAIAEQLGEAVSRDLREIELARDEAEAGLDATRCAAEQLLIEEVRLTELSKMIKTLAEEIELAGEELVKRGGQLDQIRKNVDEDAQKHKDAVGDRDLKNESKRLEGASVALAELVEGTQRCELSQAAYLRQLKVFETMRLSSPFDDVVAVTAAAREPEEVQRLKQAHDTWMKRVTELTTLQAGLAERDISAEIPDLGVFEKALLTAEATRSNLADSVSGAEAHLETARTTLAGLQSDDARIEKGRGIAEQLAHVAEVCGGSNSSRIPLESWVLAAYLREVVRQANLHLLPMSSGRYSLVVGDEVVDRRTTSGLDIEVHDAHTGKRRGARSLSGGETFQASLALALGLADVVSAGRSGLHLDCVFVDEGFGSLDPDALELAIDVLDGLRHRGALVGVITHVAALKEVLPVGIDVQVKPDGSGSTVRQLI